MRGGDKLVLRERDCKNDNANKLVLAKFSMAFTLTDDKYQRKLSLKQSLSVNGSFDITCLSWAIRIYLRLNGFWYITV